MPIIYTYPTKTTPNDDDLLLISDSQDGNSTKKIKISSLPGGSGAGVSSITSANAAITVTNPTSTAVMTSVAYSGGANIGHVPTGSGGSATLYLDGSGNWSTPSSGGVSSFTNANGTFVSAATVNTSATGAVTTGAIDLSATGTPTSENFLRGDNTWATPSSTTYNAGTGLSLVGTTFSLATGAALTNLGGGAGGDYLRQDGSWATPTGTNIANADLTLNANRILALSSYSLQFTGTNMFRLSNAETTDNISLLIGNNLKVDGQSWVDINDGGESTGTVQINWDNGNVQEFTLSGNVSWTCTNQQPGATYIMIVNQPAGQSYTQTFSQDFDWLNNNSAPGTTTAARADVYSFVCRSATSLLGTYSEDFI